MAEEVNVDQLSPSQQEALQQYIAVTNQDTKDAISLLQKSQWNTQIAITKFFDGEGPDPVAEAIADAPREAARLENLQESMLMSDFDGVARASRRARTDPAPRIVPQPPVTRRPHWLVGLIFAPLSLGWSAAAGLLRTICYVLAFLPAPLRPRAITQGVTTGFKGTSGRRMLMPKDTASRFSREFSEEYGGNDLPFFEGGLAQAHDLAKKELKFLLIVLLSPEHDDTESFIKHTLLDPSVVSFIKDPFNNIILWGGNVLDSEAYQVSMEYKCTKFPFSALVCLTPKEGSTRMGIVKRLSGLMGARTYMSELQSALETHDMDLTMVRAERSAQEFARNLRTEQDSAYERSLAIDRERARQKKEAAAAAEAAEKLALKKAAASEVRRKKRRQWKMWRATTICPEPPANDRDVVRVAIMMPEDSGAGRIVRRFPQDAPLEELYAFVECYGAQGHGEEVSEPEDYAHDYKFRIASTLPREVYKPDGVITMGDKIGKSGNLVVELMGDEEGEDDDDAADADMK